MMMIILLRALNAVQPLMVALSVVFLVVFAGCWANYGLGLLRSWWMLRLGRDRKRRQPGEQPLCEFTAGPEGPGLVWHDRVLVEVVAEFERDTGIGGIR